MKEVQLKDAKASLSHVVDRAVAGEGAIITRRGRKEAVVISWDEYERLRKVPSLGWLIANSPLDADDLPARRPAAALGKSRF